MNTYLSVRQIAKDSWKVLKSQVWILVGLTIGYSIISSLISVFFQPQNGVSLSTVVSLFFTIFFYTLFYLGFYQNIFQAIDGEEPQFSAYVSQSKNFLKGAMASIIYGVIVIAGLALFVIPGIYLALRLQFFLISIAEGDRGVIESLKHSWRITEGNVLFLLKAAITMFLMLVLGLMLFIVGYFVAATLTQVMSCNIYRKLIAADGNNEL